MEKIICSICGKEFKNKAGLAGHLSIIHGKNGGDRYKESKSNCNHTWRRLTNSELKLIDESTGQNIYEMGYLFVCRECGELR